ncbi:hypothetical protein CBL_11224 [Carabus blaptoides fortunei]
MQTRCKRRRTNEPICAVFVVTRLLRAGKKKCDDGVGSKLKNFLGELTESRYDIFQLHKQLQFGLHLNLFFPTGTQKKQNKKKWKSAKLTRSPTSQRCWLGNLTATKRTIRTYYPLA